MPGDGTGGLTSAVCAGRLVCDLTLTKSVSSFEKGLFPSLDVESKQHLLCH